MKRLILLLVACFSLMGAHAAYLRNVPKTLTQPDGTVLHCYASGDEFFNYLHDANGFTIMQHPQTGFYVYADKRDGNLVATEYVAGRVDPASKNLKPFNLISPQEWMARRQAWEVHDEYSQNRDNINHGTLNNISIFIRFSDDTEFTNSYYDIDNMFNDESENAISLKTYFRAASYNAIEIPTTFYPGHNGDVVISYQDTYPRSYFEPYNASTNPNGYQDDERTDREFSLLERAVNYINANYPIPTNLNIDYDNDGLVDNVCFIVRGNAGAWSSLLWPHKWSLYDRTVRINGKRVWTFNFQLADATGYFNTSVMCHEMNHSLGAPDLYHYNYGTNLSPVGGWDLMENNATPPQHCGAYMKMKYGHWIDEIPEITQAGTYTLNPISSATPTNIAYKIQSDDPNQFYVLEYRDNTSLFETSLPGSGLLIYRIDTRFDGNASYNPSNGIYDEVYLFRPGGSTSSNGSLSSAHFSSEVGRTEFSAATNAYPFFTDGTIDNNFRIYNITSAGNTISFSYGISSDCNPPTNLVATVVDNNVSLSWDAAANAVSYNIYRDRTLINNTSGTTYSDNNISYGIYTYFLKSVDANGLLSLASEAVTVSYLPEGAVIIGSGSSATDDLLPSYSYYKYALTQQIYTAEDLGEAGVITSIAFYNGGATKTRTYDFYLKTTTKSAFTDASDWEVVTAADKVFSGSVNMVENEWTFITFDTPFTYDGTSNLVLVADDNTGAYTNSPHMSCRVFDAPSQTLLIYSDGSNYDPIAPESYSGTVTGVKNQLLITKVIPSSDIFNVTVSANPEEGGFVTIGRLFFDFEDGTSQGWTYLKGSNGTSPNNWMHCVDYTPRDYTSGYGHEYSDGFMLSESYISGAGEGEGTPVYPDNYLVSPQVLLGGSIHFWVTNPNDSYGEEHFAVAVSTNSNTNIDDFSQVQEWTLQPSSKAERTGNTRTNSNGIWYEYTADLSAFSGLGYVAIHHFDCYDQWLLCIDDITITGGTLDGGRNISSAFNYGETCTVLAMPAEGYYFKNWTIANVEVSREASYTFLVTGDVDLVANFVEGYMIGDGGDATNVSLPSYNYYKYGLSQQIYTAEELGDEGLITSIAFYNAGAEKTRTYDIYMKATEKASFAGATDWETVTDFDKVFSGEVTMVVNDWTFITLDNPFIYDGTSNVVLVTDDNTGSYTNSPHMACRVFDANSQAIYVRSDNTNYDPSNPSSYTGTVLSVKNQLFFTKEPFGDCMSPSHLIATEVGPDFVVLSWTENGTATEWVVAYGSNAVTANTNEGFVLEGLDPETEYTIVVHPSCNETLSSNIITITTLEACPTPSDLEVSDVIYNAATVAWTGYSDNYNVQLGIPSFLISENFDNGIPTDWTNDATYPWTIVDGHIQSGNAGVASSSSSISVTVTYPDAGTIEFDAECKGEGTSTIWDKCIFSMDGEQQFSYGANISGWNHYIFDVTAGEHTFTWSYTKDGSVNPTGDYFAIDNVEMKSGETDWNEPIAVDDAQYTFTGLSPETTYYVRVQAVCDGTGTEWSEIHYFTTTEQTTITQTVVLEAGTNWFSANVEITLGDLQNALNDVLGTNNVIITIQSQTDNCTFKRGRWTGSLTTLDVTQMYQIEVSSNCEITLEGVPVNPADHPVTISNGENWIAYPLTMSMTLTDAFAGFAVNDDAVSSQSQNATYKRNRWTGELTTLVPGQGYIYTSSVAEDRTLVFPTAK